MPAGDEQTPVERLLVQDTEDVREADNRLTRTMLQSQRSLENYLKAGNRPRWMERIGDIEAATAGHRLKLERADRRLRAEHADDAEGFARAWRALAASWVFADVNELIEQHNAWFPIERQLAVNPRTGDYVLVNGKPYTRAPLDARWVLEQFPA